MKEDNKLILVGVISSAHGIKGDVIVKSYTDPVENIDNIKIFDSNNNEFSFKRIRTNAKGLLICRTKDCADRNQAEAIIGKKLFCLRADLPETSTEEFYFTDLISLEVRNQSGKKIGTILEVHNFGAGDLIEVKFANGSGSEMYPFTKEFFPEITNDYVILSNIVN